VIRYLLSGAVLLVACSASATLPPEITIGRPTLMYGKALSFPVSIRNVGQTPMAWVDLECTLRDEAANVSEPGHVIFENVAPGQTATEQAIYMHSRGQLTCRFVSAF